MHYIILSITAFFVLLGCLFIEVPELGQDVGKLLKNTTNVTGNIYDKDSELKKEVGDFMQGQNGSCAALAVIYAFGHTNMGEYFFRNNISEYADFIHIKMLRYNFNKDEGTMDIKLKKSEIDGRKDIAGNPIVGEIEETNLAVKSLLLAIEKNYHSRKKSFYVKSVTEFLTGITGMCVNFRREGGGYLDYDLYKNVGQLNLDESLNLVEKNPKEYICIVSFDNEADDTVSRKLFPSVKVERWNKNLSNKSDSIVSHHAYAVIEIKLADNQLVLVNPWDTRDRWHVDKDDIIRNNYNIFIAKLPKGPIT